MKYDVAVIGSGPGGYVAAIYAAISGKKTVIFEKGHIGGTCLNVGCIPTKALLASAELFKKIKKASDFGIEVEGVKVNTETMFSQKEDIVKKLRNGIEALLKGRKIDIVNERATLKEKGKVHTENGEYEADSIIIATGSNPHEITGMETDGNLVLNSTHALSCKDLPEKAVIIGGGVIGIEFASIWSTLGVKVEVVEMADEIIPAADKEIAKRLRLMLKKNKIKFHIKTKVEALDKKEDSVIVKLDSGKEIEADKVLVSVGRKLNLEDIKLDIEMDGRFVKTDGSMKTSIDGVYAIGDITSVWQLAHVASSQAFVAVDSICGKEAFFSYRAIPSCVYSIPEIAWCGKTEDELKEEGEPYKKGMFRFSALGKAMTIREKDGFVKVLSDEMDNVLGVHIIGPKATELISEANLALASRLKLYEWDGVIHAHPTLSEILMEAVHDAEGHCVHTVPR